MLCYDFVLVLINFLLVSPFSLKRSGVKGTMGLLQRNVLHPSKVLCPACVVVYPTMNMEIISTMYSLN